MSGKLEQLLGQASVEVLHSWRHRQRGSYEHVNCPKRKDPLFYHPPHGTTVNLLECLKPGKYCRNGAWYVRYGDSDICEYIVGHRFNAQYEFVFKLNLPPALAHVGLAMLYANSMDTRALDFDYEWHKPTRVGVYARNTREHIRDLATKPFCEVFSPFTNKYDSGYPEGLPLVEAVSDIYRDLLSTQPTFSGDLDEDLWTCFERSMQEFITSPCIKVMRTGKTRKLGVALASDIEHTYWFRRGDVDLDAFRSAREKLSTGPVCVSVLPKIGAVKSDGRLRRVFPMSPTLQIGLENVFGKRFPRYQNVTLVRGAQFPSHRYTYDIKGADTVIGPYLHRWATRYRPDLLPLLFPPIITPDGTRWTEQFLSGLLGTSHIVEAFTVAVARACTSKHVWIQGDGIMCEEELEHPLLRRCEDYTINGFFYGNDTPEYVNGPLRLNSPRIHNPGKLSGHEGWYFRYEIYLRFLNAKNLPPVARLFGHLSDSDLLLKAYKEKYCVRKLAMVGYQFSYLSDAHWDYCNTQPTQVDTNDVLTINVSNLSPLSPLGAIRPEGPTQIEVKGLDCGEQMTRSGGVSCKPYHNCPCEMWASQLGPCSKCGAP